MATYPNILEAVGRTPLIRFFASVVTSQTPRTRKSEPGVATKFTADCRCATNSPSGVVT